MNTTFHRPAPHRRRGDADDYAPGWRRRSTYPSGGVRSGRPIDRCATGGRSGTRERRSGWAPGCPFTLPAPGSFIGVGVDVAVDHIGVRALDLAGTLVTERIVEGDFRSSEPLAMLRASDIAYRTCCRPTGFTQRDSCRGVFVGPRSDRSAGRDRPLCPQPGLARVRCARGAPTQRPVA